MFCPFVHSTYGGAMTEKQLLEKIAEAANWLEQADNAAAASAKARDVPFSGESEVPLRYWQIDEISSVLDAARCNIENRRSMIDETVRQIRGGAT
jgi:hypothetical protein